MILGVGTDIIEIERIQSSVERFGERFLNKIYTKAELEYSLSKGSKYQHLAGRFAAKEAISKAISNYWEIGFSWKDVEITNNSLGAPTVIFSSELAIKLPKNYKIHLSISHSQTHAIAYAILEDSI